MTDVERLYHDRLDVLSPRERMERSVALLHWSRELVARQILNDLGPMDRDRLKWEVALRFYGAEPKVRAMIRRQLDRVSD